MTSTSTDERRGIIASTLGQTLSDNWWLLLLRGVIAVVFGILAFAEPGISLTVLVLWFGAYAFVDGIATSWIAIAHRRDKENWGVLLLAGLAGIAIGVITWFAPDMTTLGLVFYVALWAIVTGVMELVLAIRLRKEIEGEWSLGLAGIVAILFGVVLIARPGPGALALLYVIAAFAILFGIAQLVFAFRMRSFAHRLTTFAHA
jgi:uncharacterized membrane protein HdeD (DUF308 family)